MGEERARGRTDETSPGSSSVYHLKSHTAHSGRAFCICPSSQRTIHPGQHQHFRRTPAPSRRPMAIGVPLQLSRATIRETPFTSEIFRAARGGRMCSLAPSSVVTPLRVAVWQVPFGGEKSWRRRAPRGWGGTGARLRVRPGLAEPAFLLLLLLRQARHGDSNSQDLRVASDFAFCIGRLRRRTGSQSGETASPEGTMVRLHPSLVRYYRQVTDKFRCRGLLGEAVANGNIPEIAIDADQ